MASLLPGETEAFSHTLEFDLLVGEASCVEGKLENTGKKPAVLIPHYAIIFEPTCCSNSGPKG